MENITDFWQAVISEFRITKKHFAYVWFSNNYAREIYINTVNINIQSAVIYSQHKKVICITRTVLKKTRQRSRGTLVRPNLHYKKNMLM